MQDFIKISRYAGMRNDLAQAGGGNTSMKVDDTVMLVKSSGFQLADVDEQTGYSQVDYRKIVDYFTKNVAGQNEDVFTEEIGKQLLKDVHLEGGRASIETFLHAITGKYTLHSHPTLVNILTARKDGMEILHKLFPKAVLVPYRKPGAALAETYYKLFKEQEAQGADGNMVFMANHGLVISGENAEEVIHKTEAVLAKIAEFLQVDDSAYTNATRLYETTQQIELLADKIVYVSENRYLSQDFAGKTLVEQKQWEHAFCPDCVVYANKKILCLEEQYTKQDILEFMEQYGLPTLVYHMGHFYILAESVKKAQEIENVMSFAARVQYHNIGYDMNYLNDEQEEELLNWDSEKYRRMMK